MHCVWWEVPRFFFFFQAEDGIRDLTVTGVQTCALPISIERPLEEYYTPPWIDWDLWLGPAPARPYHPAYAPFKRSEEHTSELQSQSNLVCRLLLEKKKKKKITQTT